MNKKPKNTHFNQKPRRKAEFIKPLDILKTKVGSGGLTEEILNKAQTLLENNTVDFLPMAEVHLATMMRYIDKAKTTAAGEEGEILIALIINPAMQLKANGGMFHYQLVTRISDKLIQLLEVVAVLEDDAVEMLLAFHTSLQSVLQGRITGSGGKPGDELMQALEDTCLRYFERYPDNKLAVC